jgi:hypothetical protein
MQSQYDFRFSTPVLAVRIRPVPVLAVRSVESHPLESIWLPTFHKGAAIRGVAMDYAVLYS